MKFMLSLLCCALLVFGFAASSLSADVTALYKRCVSCHGPDGSKAPHVVKGQKAQVLMEKMNGYITGSYGGEQKIVMRNMLKSFATEDLQALAEYIEKF